METITWRLETKNLDETIAALAHWQTGMVKVTASALYGIAEEVMTSSKDIVPVDTGNLKSTGHVQPPKISGPIIEVTLGYGGTAADGEEVGYAWYVHENSEAQHAAPTQWKYLETPLNERMNNIDHLLALAINELMTLR